MKNFISVLRMKARKFMVDETEPVANIRKGRSFLLMRFLKRINTNIAGNFFGEITETNKYQETRAFFNNFERIAYLLSFP